MYYLCVFHFQPEDSVELIYATMSFLICIYFCYSISAAGLSRNPGWVENTGWPIPSEYGKWTHLWASQSLQRQQDFHSLAHPHTRYDAQKFDPSAPNTYFYSKTVFLDPKVPPGTLFGVKSQTNVYFCKLMCTCNGKTLAEYNKGNTSFINDNQAQCKLVYPFFN